MEQITNRWNHEQYYLNGRGYYRSFNFLFLYVTERCNLRCKHCYIGDRLSKPNEFTLNKAIEALDYFRRLGSNLLFILGGEPLLYPWLDEIIDYAYELRYYIVITTNGVWEVNILKKIDSKKVRYLSFSLDGSSPKIHDMIRGKGTYEKCVKNMKIAQDMGFNIRIVSTISGFNLKDGENILNIATKMNISLVDYHIFSVEERGRNYTSWDIAAKKWIEFCKRLEENPLVSTGIEVYYPPTYCTPEDFEIYLERGYRGCLGKNIDRVSLFPDGSAYICSLFYDTKLNFGIFNESRLNLNRSCLPNELELFWSLPNGCIKCEYKNVCSGGCPAARYLYGEEKIKKLCNEKIISICRLWTTRAEGRK
ncbi:MAG: radical SAM protein [Candidatus Desulfofervidus auxilii]|nr:radical SAM protein [Candidatus Desulfofervidus auxilii]